MTQFKTQAAVLAMLVAFAGGAQAQAVVPQPGGSLSIATIYRTVAPGLAGVQGVAHHNTKDLGAIVATLADHPT